MRRALIGSVFCTVVTVLLLAAPAGAKGFGSTTFTGPGLPPGGVTIQGGPGSGGVNVILFQTGVFGTKTAGPWTEGLDRSELGAPYRMVTSPDWDPSSHVVVLVYPYANGGPWTYTPPNQGIGPGTEMVVGGWWQVGHRLIGSFSPRIAAQFRHFLVRRGFPGEAPAYTAPATALPGQPVQAAPAEKTAVGPSSTGPRGDWPVWAWILIATGIVGALLLVADRQRRRVAA
jgi:hypothetical protein